MNSILLPIHLFPSIEYYAFLVNKQNYIFEINDHFQKQTYRNRYYIYGSNGKLNLNIPTKHNKSSKLYKDTEICYDNNWNKNHLKSLNSAYQSSPFYEFYIDNLIPLFEVNEKYLVDFNIKTFNLVNNLLDINIEVNFTKEYNNEPKELDLRNYFNSKKESSQEFDSYIQVFSYEKGFIKNLSILDLIFNEGPNALTYLENIKLQ